MMHRPAMDDPTLPQGARVAIIGAARSGCAAARFLLDRGHPVFISDSCASPKLEAALSGAGLSAVPHESDANTDRVLDADAIVLSPGVPSNIAVLIKARERGIPVWSEIELTYRYSRAPILAITGSSGKSTTTSLLGAAIVAGGRPCVTAGNIGLAAIAAVPQLGPEGVAVLEVSSFQLETIDAFRPRGAAVLNIMANHLDRYRDIDEYFAAKKAIARAMTRNDFIVLNAGDDRLRAWARELVARMRVIWFGARREKGECVWIDNTVLRSDIGGRDVAILDVREMMICGPHNHQNAAAAAAMGIAFGADPSGVARGIASFPGLKHRLEFAGEARGVRYYNDSKSTTAESVLCAVTAFGDNVHLIAGGRDKGCDFTVATSAVKRHVRKVYLIGEAADRMAAVWQDATEIETYRSLEDALGAAAANAKKGDVVVLSPGCSSFDMFTDYEHRGNLFKELVHALAA
jgi:UDP-N-acetylmuramoylalanine--D-glutamate ligase